MNIKALFAGGLLAVSASASMAQSLDPVRIEMFRSILAGNECTLTETAASNILPRFDFTREETRSIVGALVAAGEVELDGNTLMLVDGSCATEDPVVALLERADVQQFIAVMSEYNCAMSEADAEQIFTDRGISKAQVGAVVGPMIGASMARFEAGVLSVSSAYCSAPVVVQETAPVVGSPVETPAEMVELDRSGMFGMGRVRQLVDVMAANSCTLNMETPDAFLLEAGIEHSFATFVARKMVADGFASMMDAQNMQLPAPYCVSANSPAPVVVASAEPSLEERVATLRQIFVENACNLTNAQMDIVLPPAGFTKDNIVAVFDVFEARGELTIFDDHLEMTGAGCPAVPVETVASDAVELDRSGMFGMGQVRELVDVMAQNGCALNMEVADGYLAEAGIEHSFASFIAKKMMADGFASMADAQNMLLPAPYCIAAGGAAPVAVPTTGVNMAMVDTMRRIFAENGCRLGNEQMDALLPPAGFTRDNVGPVFDVLEANGEMTKVDGILILTGDMCGDDTAGDLGPRVEVPRIPGMSDEAMKVVVVFNAVGCEIPVSNTNDVFEAAGMTLAEGMTGIQPFIVNGQVRVSDSGGEFIMDREICDPASAVVQADASTDAPATDVPQVAAVAFENDGSPRGRFLSAVIANGCALEISGAESYLADTADLRMDQAFRIVDDLLAEGQAALISDKSTVQIDLGYCAETGTALVIEQVSPGTQEAISAPIEAATNSTGPRAGVLAMLAANNCEVTQADVAGLAQAAGLDLNATMQILGAMMNAGEATSPDFGQTLQVAAPLCVAAEATPMTPREVFINLIKQNNCSITAAEFSTMLPVGGLDANTAFAMISELEAEGVISLPASRDVVTLSTEMCR